MVNGPSGANAMQLAEAVLGPDPVSVTIKAKVSKPQKVFLFFAISSQLQNKLKSGKISEVVFNLAPS